MQFAHPHYLGDYITGDVLVTNPYEEDLDEFPKYPPWYSKPLPVRQIPILPLGTFRNNYTPDCQIDFNTQLYGPDVHFYELTFTQPDTLPKDPYDLLTALTKVVQSKMHQIIDYLSVIELTKSGTPHLHALLISRCYINKSKIQYPYRFSLSKVKSISAWINYLMKDNFSPDIISYCHSKGIDPSNALQKTSDEKETPYGEQEV